jgi:hypothetical protein
LVDSGEVTKVAAAFEKAGEVEQAKVVRHILQSDA